MMDERPAHPLARRFPRTWVFVDEFVGYPLRRLDDRLRPRRRAKRLAEIRRSQAAYRAEQGEGWPAVHPPGEADACQICNPSAEDGRNG